MEGVARIGPGFCGTALYHRQFEIQEIGHTNSLKMPRPSPIRMESFPWHQTAW